MNSGVHAQTFTIDSAGRIIVVGANYIARFTADGALDTTFSEDGWATDDHVSQCYGVTIEADGNYLVTGRDNEHFRLSRWSPDGSRTATYDRDVNGDDRDYARSVISKDDGDVLILGTMGDNTNYPSQYRDIRSHAVVRLNRDLFFEAEYNYDFGSDANEFVNSALALPDGKFLMVGNSDGQLAVSRYLSSGEKDTSFGTNGLVELPVLNGSDIGIRATLAADGKILITGYADNGSNEDLTVTRLNHDGSVDDTFGTNGSVAFDISGNDYGYAIASLADGKILVAGRAGNDIALVRLLGDSDQTAAAANEAPINSVPGAQTVISGVPYAFSAPRGNLISVADADAAENAIKVTLSADQGTVTLVHADPDGRITYLDGDGFEDSTVTFTGTVTAVNTALQWVSYKSPADYTGDVTLTLTTDDLGNVGLGGALTDTDSIAITVEAVAFDASPTYPTLPSVLDVSLDGDGKQMLSVSDGTDFIIDMQELDDGKILAVGFVNGNFGVMRFNTDMTLDDTFGTNGSTEMTGFAFDAKAFAIDSVGRIVVVGGNRIARFTADGALDTTFSEDGWATDDHVSQCYGVTIEADGNYLVTGRDNEHFRLSRWSPDGSRTATYDRDVNGDDRDYARSVISKDDGDVLILGTMGDNTNYPSYRDIRSHAVVRLNRDLFFEAEYNYDFGSDANEFVNSALALPDGKFLMVGNSDGQLAVSRYLSSGEKDTSFGTNGLVELPVLNGSDIGIRATLAADGKILITGYADNGSNEDLTVTRLNHDGSVDDTFGTNGSVAFDISGNDYGYAIASLADGKILVAGRAGNDIALVRLLGDSDQTAAAANEAPINSVPGAQTVISGVPYAFSAPRGNLISVADADAAENAIKVTLSADQGTVTLVHADPDGRITYLDGDVFEDSTVTFTGTVTAVNTALQWVSYKSPADYTGDVTLTLTTDDLGNVGLGGALTDTDSIAITVEAVAFDASPTYPTLPSVLDVSLDGDGKQMLSVSDGTDFIIDMQELDDGKILAVGFVNGNFGVMRFNTDMTLDDTFGTNGSTEMTGFAFDAKAFAIDSVGRIVVVGGNRIARFTADGALDTTFSEDGWATDDHVSQCYGVTIEADGNYLVTGRDNEHFRLSRWSPDGSRTATYDRDVNGDDRDYARSVISKDDGDVLILGTMGDNTNYPSYRDIRSHAVVRLNRDLFFEAEYNYDFGSDANEFVNSALALPDGKFLMVGNSDGQLAVSRYLSSGEKDTSFGTNGLVELPVLNGSDIGIRATLAADGKILITGYADNGSNEDLTVTRLNHDGSVDDTFGTNGSVAFDISGNDYGYAIASLADGKILVAGRAGNDIALVRLLGDSDQTAAAANEAPINSVPGAQTVISGVPYAFSAPRGNLISVADADAAENAIKVTLSADQGTVTLVHADPDGRITYLDGDGFEDSTVTFTGTVTAVNTALQWVSYKSPADYTGDVTLTLTTDDLGNVGLGGALTDTDSIAITVEAVAFDASPTYPTLPSVLDVSLDGDGKQMLSVSDGTDFIIDMQELDDGKILAVGFVNGNFGVMRFNTDMTLDDTFGTNGSTEMTGFAFDAKAFAIDSVGRIVVVGGNRIARFTADGALDTTFSEDGWATDDHVSSATASRSKPTATTLLLVETTNTSV